VSRQRVCRALAVTVVVLGVAACGQTSAPPKATVDTRTACGRSGVPVHRVHDAGGLTAALAAVQGGESIELAPGHYAGHFEAATSATHTRPILVCGPATAVLDGGTNGYTLHLDGASWWTVSGLTVKGGQKGVVLDATDDTTLTDLTVTGTQEEGVHLRTGSSHDVIDGLRVSHTGLGTAKFGEGIYVGSAKENWCRYSGCGPDTTDSISIVHSVFGRGIAAEAIDVKEGTTGGTIADNRFDGTGTTSVDSIIDVKGNGWWIHDNTFVHPPVDAVQIHVRVPGWGGDDVVTANVVTDVSGYAVRVADAVGTVIVGCSNHVPDRAQGITNVTCVEGR
jgi:hypothetical protein